MSKPLHTKRARAGSRTAPTSAPITLTVPQSEVFMDPSRFKVVCAGRRFGKTFLALAYLLLRGCNPSATNLTLWYVAPTYRQAKEIAWRLLKRLLPHGWATKINETDLSIELKRGCVIALRGADNPDSLRGVSLDALVLDEYASMAPDAWHEVLRPALADKQGCALFIGTPKGFNHFHDCWSKAHALDGWRAWQFTTMDGGNVQPEEIEMARKEMDERSFKQEFLASFESLAGRVYSNFERSIHVRSDIADTHGTVMVGMDFNIVPMSACIGFKVGEELHIVDELEIEHGNTETMAVELKRRYPGRHITVYPDPSGKARKTSAPIGETDHEILRQHGFRVLSPNSAPRVVDRVNTVQTLLRNMAGEPRLFIHPRCTKVIKCLEGLTYADGTSFPDKKSGLEHMTDALGYLVCHEFPLIKRYAWVQEILL